MKLLDRHSHDFDMIEERLYLLLNLIFRNGNVKRLTRQGITFLQIAEETNSAIVKGLVTYDGSRVVLTDSGVETLKALSLEYKRTNKEVWIEPDLKSQIPKLDKNFIFLPRQNELTFDL